MTINLVSTKIRKELEAVIDELHETLNFDLIQKIFRLQKQLDIAVQRRAYFRGK